MAGKLKEIKNTCTPLNEGVLQFESLEIHVALRTP